MNAIFCGMLLLGALVAALQGRADAAQQALLSGGAEAVNLLLGMAGAYAFFGGLLGVMRASGLHAALCRGLRRPLKRLFPFAPGEERALEDIGVNLAANMLGMGGAATPAGIRAMRTMAQASTAPGVASDAMLLFLSINTSSVQLLPSTMIALRAQAGSHSPADIVWPTWIATALSTLCAVLLCRALQRRGGTR